MNPASSFDAATAHHHFAADCFNRTWDLLDKPERTPEENQQMLLLSMASLWHWTQRPDCTGKNLSIAYWQISRVYVALGQAENATRFAEQCLHHSHDLPPFYLAYAHEALARAAALTGNTAHLKLHLRNARDLLSQITDEDSRQAIEKDLASLAK